MPLAEAHRYLAGLLEIVGVDPVGDSLREVFRHLAVADDRLELIASGQLKLNLDGNYGQ